ncbi:hypothetical protein P7K49_009888 [Saguinus oedipus]|uniref:RNF114 n=1 Tax=Saguinus oedipus TaxID=9490 RepID=A0ABQ9VLN9_SAGOE|nr:hypothetical protein P7K49_009888 [Saguinus oedipus]
MAAQQQCRESTAQLAGPAAEADPLGRFTCPVCLEVYEKPVQRRTRAWGMEPRSEAPTSWGDPEGPPGGAPQGS